MAQPQIGVDQEAALSLESLSVVLVKRIKQLAIEGVEVSDIMAITGTAFDEVQLVMEEPVPEPVRKLLELEEGVNWTFEEVWLSARTTLSLEKKTTGDNADSLKSSVIKDLYERMQTGGLNTNQLIRLLSITGLPDPEGTPGHNFMGRKADVAALQIINNNNNVAPFQVVIGDQSDKGSGIMVNEKNQVIGISDASGALVDMSTMDKQAVDNLAASQSASKSAEGKEIIVNQRDGDSLRLGFDSLATDPEVGAELPLEGDEAMEWLLDIAKDAGI